MSVGAKVSRLYRKFVLGEQVEEINQGGSVANELKYPQSAIEAFSQGVRLDLRVRMAIDFMKTPLAAEYMKSMSLETAPATVAKFSLDLADAVLVDAEQRGWTAPMPESDELDAATKKQARRNARFQTEQQVAGQRAMQELAAGAIATPHGARPPN